MNIIWITIQFIIGFNLVLPFMLYLGTFFIKKSSKRETTDKSNLDYGIIVTAYEQTLMLGSVIDSLLNLNYDRYHIYVVADNCDISVLKFSHPKVTILRPESVLASNTKSHFYAIDRFIRKHEVVTIIDSDNLVDTEYINQLNEFFEQGFVAVQGKREPKNLSNNLSCLDAARDLYYHFYDSEVLFNLGSSSTLAGSGMAFKTEVYKDCLGHLDIVGAGFDKVLQTQLLMREYRIASASKAIVYDEKTSHSDQFIKQRSRWINTWFKYFIYGFKLVSMGIKNRNWNQTLFGTNLLRPPLFIFILFSFMFFSINVFMGSIVAFIWFCAFIIFILGFFIALKKQNTSQGIYIALGSIPKFMFYQIVSLYYLRTANKRSVATKHSGEISFQKNTQ